MDRRNVGKNVMRFLSKYGAFAIAAVRWALDEWRNGGGPGQSL